MENIYKSMGKKVLILVAFGEEDLVREIRFICHFIILQTGYFEPYSSASFLFRKKQVSKKF